MNFKNIEAADRSLFIRYLDGEKRRLCEYCFTDLYMWKDLYNTEWCLENDILYIRQSLDKEGKFFYYYPPLPTKSKLVYGVKNIIIDSVIEGYEFSIGGVNLEVLADIGRYYKGAFHAEINRDYADYIYLASDLINLSGRKFHKKTPPLQTRCIRRCKKTPYVPAGCGAMTATFVFVRRATPRPCGT
jgi:hypothetical protein